MIIVSIFLILVEIPVWEDSETPPLKFRTTRYSLRCKISQIIHFIVTFPAQLVERKIAKWYIDVFSSGKNGVNALTFVKIYSNCC